MTDIIKIDFTEGDGVGKEKIEVCTMCGRDGVRVETRSIDSTIFEHVLLFAPLVKRSRFEIIDGCFRQKHRAYEVKEESEKPKKPPAGGAGGRKDGIQNK